MASSRKHILVVEDDAPTRESIQQILTDEGYRVTTAVCGRDAVDQIVKHRDICMILLDLFMPHDGIEVLMKKRASDPQIERIPIIVLTASPQSIPSAVHPIHVIPKPFDLDTLLRAVTSHCPV